MASTTTRSRTAKKTTPAKKATSAKAAATRVAVNTPSPLGPIPEGSRRSADIESLLLELGVTDFEYHDDVPIEEFDVDKSLNNQARLKQIDEEVVARYTEAWQRGDQFPPVIAYRRSKKLIQVDGNHRMVSAGKAGVPALAAYEIKAAPKTVAVLTMMANSRHGLPTNVEERVTHAIYLMDNGLSREQAAARLGVPVKEITRRRDKVMADRRATDVGILMSDWDRITQSTRLKLAQISTDEGFEAAAKLALAAHLIFEEASDLVTNLNLSRSGRRQVQLVKEMEQAYAERIEQNAGGMLGGRNSRQGMSPKGRFHMALAQIGAIPDDFTSLVASYAETERHEAAERARKTAKRLTDLAAALEG